MTELATLGNKITFANFLKNPCKFAKFAAKIISNFKKT